MCEALAAGLVVIGLSLGANTALCAEIVVFSTIRTARARSAVGAGLLLLGIPVFYLFKARTRNKS